MMILGWQFTFLQHGQIYVLIVVAILEDAAWYLQIYSGCFTQVSKLKPMGFLYVIICDLLRCLPDAI